MVYFYPCGNAYRTCRPCLGEEGTATSDVNSCRKQASERIGEPAKYVHARWWLRPISPKESCSNVPLKDAPFRLTAIVCVCVRVCVSLWLRIGNGSISTRRSNSGAKSDGAMPTKLALHYRPVGGSRPTRSVWEWLLLYFFLQRSLPCSFIFPGTIVTVAVATHQAAMNVYDERKFDRHLVIAEALVSCQLSDEICPGNGAREKSI